jgi:excisionase family DNA binding protein
MLQCALVRLSTDKKAQTTAKWGHIVEQQGLSLGKDLLHTEDVASYLGVGQVTVWRWCRDGTLPCLKIGREWRIRREALERFLEQSERSETLVGRLRSFLEVPDNVLSIAQDRQMMHRLDAAFLLRVGEAKGGRLIKYLGGEETWNSLDEVRSELERYGLEVGRLEEEGRLRFIFEPDPQQGGRAEELRRLLSEQADGGDRSVWVCFNWAEQMDMETALEHQQTLQEVGETSQLVVKTGVLEKNVDEWPGKMLRRAQVLHSGTIWLSESGLALNRVTPAPPLR